MELKQKQALIMIWILGNPECPWSVANQFNIVFIAEFVEQLPTIFAVNIWSTYLFEIEHHWAEWLMSDPSPKGTRWINDPMIRL